MCIIIIDNAGAELIPYNIFTDVDWRVLGLLLGLSDSTLESIQIKSSSEEQCQQSMIDQWISTGQAYWSLLVDALEGPVLGEIDLASKIVEEHFGKIIIIIIVVKLSSLKFYSGPSDRVDSLNNSIKKLLKVTFQ